jgi:hypothetical protein
MTKVFIGGSRRVNRLSDKVRQRLDEIIKKQLPVVIGDANGADKAVQQYFHRRGYTRVEVFCTEGRCRNNLGQWAVRPVAAPRRNGRDFEYYAAKDRQMAQEASVGFMLWDAKSRGTLANVLHLINLGKKAVVYVSPSLQFIAVRNPAECREFLSRFATNAELSAYSAKAQHELAGLAI